MNRRELFRLAAAALVSACTAKFFSAKTHPFAIGGTISPRTPYLVGESGTECWFHLPPGLKSIDAVFLDSRKLSREEICHVFRVPPEMVREA